MKNYAVALLMKKGSGDTESDTLLMVQVSVNDEAEVLSAALKTDQAIELTASGHRFEMRVYDKLENQE